MTASGQFHVDLQDLDAVSRHDLPTVLKETIRRHGHGLPGHCGRRGLFYDRHLPSVHSLISTSGMLRACIDCSPYFGSPEVGRA